VAERDPEYVKQLEDTLKKFLEPVHGVPLGVVVRALTGRSAIPWRDEDAHCRVLRPPLCEGIAEATRQIGREGLDASRPNEVGNYIEKPVASVLTAKGFVAQVPASVSGRRQSTGYPDILLTMPPHPPIYLEVKTYSAASETTTFRSFYFSPPLSKVSQDAYHLLVAFKIEKRAARFYPIRFRLYSIDKLLLDVKHEFNTSNKVLFSTCPVIAEGAA
jgi:hypothetical protein